MTENALTIPEAQQRLKQACEHVFYETLRQRGLAPETREEFDFALKIAAGLQRMGWQSKRQKEASATGRVYQTIWSHLNNITNTVDPFVKQADALMQAPAIQEALRAIATADDQPAEGEK